MAKNLISAYRGDLEENLVDELKQFVSLVKTLERETITTVHCLLSILVKSDLIDVFHNVYIYIYIVLRIYVCIPITNCEAERSFSKLTFIKNKYRSSMGETRLSHLALMSIENDVLSKLSFDDIIDEFSKVSIPKK